MEGAFSKLELKRALESAGYVTGSSGAWVSTSTSICHGGDSAHGLNFNDEGGTFNVRCWTSPQCNDNKTQTRRKLYEAAGIKSKSNTQDKWRNKPQSNQNHRKQQHRNEGVAMATNINFCKDCFAKYTDPVNQYNQWWKTNVTRTGKRGDEIQDMPKIQKGVAHILRHMPVYEPLEDMGYDLDHPISRWKTETTKGTYINPHHMVFVKDANGVEYAINKDGDPRHDDLVRAMRFEIKEQLEPFRVPGCQVDHVHPPFATIKNEFIASVGNIDVDKGFIGVVGDEEISERRFTDRNLALQWQEYHKENAWLESVTLAEHKRRTARANDKTTRQKCIRCKEKSEHEYQEDWIWWCGKCAPYIPAKYIPQTLCPDCLTEFESDGNEQCEICR